MLMGKLMCLDNGLSVSKADKLLQVSRFSEIWH